MSVIGDKYSVELLRKKVSRRRLDGAQANR